MVRLPLVRDHADQSDMGTGRLLQQQHLCAKNDVHASCASGVKGIVSRLYPVHDLCQKHFPETDTARIVLVFSEGQRFGPVAGECELLSHGVEPLIF